MTMNEHTRDSLVRHPWVTIEAAAELTDVDVPTLRGWARRGALVIEQRGDMEVVELEEVRALASRERASRHGALRDRLGQADGTAPSGEVVNVADLQESARERSDD
jgi:phage terminase Nu1 subunit (DNA packaging protein)